MCSMLLMPTTNSNAAGEGMTVKLRQDDIAILCPDQIAYQIQPVEQWNAGTYRSRKLRLAEITLLHLRG